MWSLAWACRGRRLSFLFFVFCFFCFCLPCALIETLDFIIEAERSCLSPHTIRNSLCSALRFAPRSARSIRSLGVRSRCRSNKRRATWPCCRRKKRPVYQCERVADWLCSFYATCVLLIGCVNKRTDCRRLVLRPIFGESSWDDRGKLVLSLPRFIRFLLRRWWIIVLFKSLDHVRKTILLDISL